MKSKFDLYKDVVFDTYNVDYTNLKSVEIGFFCTKRQAVSIAEIYNTGFEHGEKSYNDSYPAWLEVIGDKIFTTNQVCCAEDEDFFDVYLTGFERGHLHSTKYITKKRRKRSKKKGLKVNEND